MYRTIIAALLCGTAFCATARAESLFWFRMGGAFGHADYVPPSTQNPGTGTQPGGGTGGDQPDEDVPDIGTEDETDVGPIRILSVTEPSTQSSGASDFDGVVRLAGDRLPGTLVWDEASIPAYALGNGGFGVTAAPTTHAVRDAGRTFDLSWDFQAFAGWNENYEPLYVQKSCAFSATLVQSPDPNVWDYGARLTRGTASDCVRLGPVGMKAEDVTGNVDRWTSSFAAAYDAAEPGSILIDVPETVSLAGTQPSTVPVKLSSEDPLAGSTLVFRTYGDGSSRSCGPDLAYTCLTATSDAGRRKSIRILDANGQTTQVAYALTRTSNDAYSLATTRTGVLDLPWIEAPSMAAVAGDAAGTTNAGTIDFGVERVPAPALASSGSPSPDPDGYAPPAPDEERPEEPNELDYGPFFVNGRVVAKYPTLLLRFWKVEDVTHVFAPTGEYAQTTPASTKHRNDAGPTGGTVFVSNGSGGIVSGSDLLIKKGTMDWESGDEAGGWVVANPISGPDADGYYRYDPSFSVRYRSEYVPCEGVTKGMFTDTGTISIQEQFVAPKAVRDPAAVLRLPSYLHNVSEAGPSISCGV